MGPGYLSIFNGLNRFTNKSKKLATIEMVVCVRGIFTW